MVLDCGCGNVGNLAHFVHLGSGWSMKLIKLLLTVFFTPKAKQILGCYILVKIKRIIEAIEANGNVCHWVHYFDSAIYSSGPRFLRPEGDTNIKTHQNVIYHSPCRV